MPTSATCNWIILWHTVGLQLLANVLSRIKLQQVHVCSRLRYVMFGMFGLSCQSLRIILLGLVLSQFLNIMSYCLYWTGNILQT